MYTRWIGAVTCALVAAAPASSQCFNVDLGTAHGSPSPTYEGAAGQPGFWNGIPIVEGVLVPLLDLAGNPTKARFLIKSVPSSSGLSGSATGGPTGEDEQLYNDFINDNWMMLRFERLEPGTYLIYTYGWSLDAGGGNRILVTVKGGLHSFDFCGDAPWPGGHLVNDTYVTDLVNVDASGRVQIVICNYLGPGRPSGFQLVKIGACPSASLNYCDQGPVELCDSSVRVSGRPSRSLNQRFQIETLGVLSQRGGFYLYTVRDRQTEPWLDSGLRCLVPPVARTARLSTGPFELGLCNGQLSLDFNDWMATHPHSSPPPGATVQMQGWTYDPAQPSSPAHMLDAIEFTIEP